MTLQQLMGMVQGLQDAVVASKVEQERMEDAMATSKVEQEHIQADLATSQARNDELHHANEELRRGWRGRDEPEAASPPREFTTPFSQVILETTIPNTFTGPKATFTGTEDPEAHLTAFHTDVAGRRFRRREVQAFHEHLDRDGYGLVHQPPRGPRHVLRPTLTTIQGAVSNQQDSCPSLI